MTRIIIRSVVLLGLGLTLTACAQHNPPQANGSVANDTVGWNRRSTGQTYAASSAKV